jgi:integrase
MEVASVFDEFLVWQSGRHIRATGEPLAPATVRTKRQRLGSLMRTLKAGDERCMATLLTDRSTCVSLLDRLYVDYAPATVQLQVKTLRQFSEYAVAMGWVDSCALTAADAPPAVRQTPVRIYEQRDIDLMLAGARARDLRHWAFLATVVDTGRRVGEVLGLRWDCLHLDETPAYFDLPTTKNKRQAFVPLSRRLREEVFTPEHIHHMQSHGHGKLKRDIGQYPFPYTYEAAVQRLQRLCRDIGVPCYGHHAFRHTKATQLLAKGIPIQAVSGLLGHSSIVTTDRYYHHATTLSYAKYVDQ